MPTIYPLSKCVCTLTYQCIVQHGNEADFSITKQSTISMTSIQEFNVTVECKESIVQHICSEKEVAQTTEPIVVIGETTVAEVDNH